MLTYRLEQWFPTFLAARTPFSGQNILRTPKKKILVKFCRYILLNYIGFIGQLNVKPVFTQNCKNHTKK